MFYFTSLYLKIMLQIVFYMNKIIVKFLAFSQKHFALSIDVFVAS